MGWIYDTITSLTGLLNLHGSRHTGSGADPIPLVTALDDGLMSSADKTKLDNISSPLTLKGTIHVAADFPTLAAVQVGWSYLVDDPVTDNDPAKTNTGDSFMDGELIAWNGAGWTITNKAPYFKLVVQQAAGDYTLALNDDGVEITDCSAPRTVTIPTAMLARSDRAVMVKNATNVTNGVIVVGEGGELIEGEASQALSGGDSISLYNRGGTAWGIW